MDSEFSNHASLYNATTVSVMIYIFIALAIPVVNYFRVLNEHLFAKLQAEIVVYRNYLSMDNLVTNVCSSI